MEIKKNVKMEKETVEDVLCNKCGFSCKRVYPNSSNDDGEFYGLIEVSFSTGYLSDPLPDCQIYTFSLCETCLYDLFASFKIKPEQEDYML